MIKRTIFILCTMLTIISSSCVFAAVNPDFSPKWLVGDSWITIVRKISASIPAVPETIEAGGHIERPDAPEYIQFEVVDLKEIDGEMCYIVEITEKDSKNEEALQLYVRKNDFTLKKVLEINKRSDGTAHIDNFHNNDHDFVIFLDPFCITIPCDFPNFPSTNTNEERSIKHSTFGLMTQKVTFIDSNTVEIELSTENNNGLLKTIQIWEKGKPWWSSVKRTFTYKDITKPGHPEVTRVENDNLLVGTDLIPPDLNISVNPSVLWPPNHKMVEIIPTMTVTDDYDRYPEVKVYSVESNEPDDAPGAGDGHTAQDIQTTKVWDSKQHKMVDKIFLRAERDAKGDGRIYTITYSATDFSGNISTASATVTVPHDKEKKK